MARVGGPKAGRQRSGFALVELLLVIALLVAALLFLLPAGSAVPGTRVEGFARLLEAKVAEAARLAAATQGEVSLVTDGQRIFLRDRNGRELFSAPVPRRVTLLSQGAPFTGEVVRYNPKGVRVGGPPEIVVEAPGIRFRFTLMEKGTVRREGEVVP